MKEESKKDTSDIPGGCTDEPCIIVSVDGKTSLKSKKLTEFF